MKIGVWWSSDLPTTTFMRSGSPSTLGSVAHSRNSGTLTKIVGSFAIGGSQRIALHRQLHLPDAVRDRDVERLDRPRADDAVGLEAVPALEALDRVDERPGVEGHALGVPRGLPGAAARSPKAWSRAASDGTPAHGLPGSTFFNGFSISGTRGGSPLASAVRRLARTRRARA